MTVDGQPSYQKGQLRINLAYDVFHYDHILEAIRSNQSETRAVLPKAAGSTAVRMARLPGMSHTPLARLANRPRREQAGLTRRSLGPAEFVKPALRALRIPHHDLTDLRVIRSYGRRVARTLRGQTLHFSEGLGAESIATNTHERYLGERRNVHISAIWNALDRESYAAFPAIQNAALNSTLNERFDTETIAAHHTIVYSPYAKSTYNSAGFSRANISVIPLATTANPVHLDDLIHNSPHALLYVGRAVKEKGIDIAVETARLLGEPYHLFVAGPATPHVVRWLAGHKYVTYLGVLPRPELWALSHRIPFFLAPSVESFGLAALDAVANGSHLFALPTTGVATLLPPNAVTILDSHSPDFWAENICAARESGEHNDANNRRDAAIAAASNTWAASTNALRTLYQHL